MRTVPVYRCGTIPTLPKELKIGDSVLAMFAFASDHGSVTHGDEGTVVGPCNNSALSKAKERVNCSFPGYRSLSGLNVLASQIIKSSEVASLPGGFRPGQKIVAGFAYSSDECGRVDVGDEGLVLGICNNRTLSAPAERLNCSFVHYSGDGGLNVFAAQVVADDDGFDDGGEREMQWVPGPSMHTARKHAATCADAVSKCFVIGGTSSEGVVLDSAETFDISTKRWSALPPMASPRTHAGACSCAGKIYVLGGSDQAGAPLASVAALYVSSGMWVAAPSMQVERADVAVCGHQGKIFAVGGFNGVDALQSVEMFDCATNTWSNAPPMSVARSGAGVCVVGSTLWVIGGWSGQRGSKTRLASAETLDLETLRWSRVAPKMASARGDHGVCTHGENIYSVGGTNGQAPLATGEFLDVSEKNEWRGLPDMPSARAGAGVCMVAGILHVVGGTDGGECLGTMDTCRLKKHVFDHVLPPVPSPHDQQQRHDLFESCTAWSAEVKKIAKSVNEKAATHTEGIRKDFEHKMQREERLYQSKALKLTDSFVGEDNVLKAEINALQGQIKRLQSRRNDNSLVYDDQVRQLTSSLDRTIVAFTDQRDAKLQASHVKAAAWFGGMETNMKAVSDIIASGAAQHSAAQHAVDDHAAKDVKAAPAPGLRQAPNEYRCPLTLDLMKDPYMAMDGNTYERAAILRWFEEHNTSPLTNEQIVATIVPNLAIRKLVEDWRSNESDA